MKTAKVCAIKVSVPEHEFCFASETYAT